MSINIVLISQRQQWTSWIQKTYMELATLTGDFSGECGLGDLDGELLWDFGINSGDFKDISDSAV